MAAGLILRLTVLFSAMAALAGVVALSRPGASISHAQDPTFSHAQDPTFSSEQATVISNTVQPAKSTVVPEVAQVQPGSAEAEAQSGDNVVAGNDNADGPFTGVRGALTGALIGVGVVAVIAALYAGFRFVVGRRAA